MIPVPPVIQAMMDVYVAETGVPVVLNYARAAALTAITLLPPEEGGEPFGAADVLQFAKADADAGRSIADIGGIGGVGAKAAGGFNQSGDLVAGKRVGEHGIA